jgi:methylmalonyl-CoA/ethylmalonyl-CoA epimerase
LLAKGAFMKILGIDHIGIAVNNIDKVMGFYNRALGLELSGIEEITDGHLKVGFIDVGDRSASDMTKIELIEPTSSESVVAKFIAKNGEGIHHVCFEVDDIEVALSHLSKEGFELIDNKPRRGAAGSKIAFVHPKSTGGVLIELKEKRRLRK